MSKAIKVLIVEDRMADADLINHELRRAGFELQSRIVDNAEDFRAALEPTLDVILSDFTMPQFDAFAALEILKSSGYDIPFIIVSGSIGEDTAVEAIKRGVTDYLLKDRMARLGQAVERVLRDRKLREGRRRAEEQQALLAAIVSSSDDAIYSTTLDGQIVTWNPGAEHLFGYSASAIVGRRMDILVPPDRLGEDRSLRATVAARCLVQRVETVRLKRDGTLVDVSLTVSPIFAVGGQVEVMSEIAHDITERRRAELDLARARDLALETARLKSVFLANISHEIRTPLHVILGYKHLIAEYLAESSDDTQHSNLEAIDRAGNRLLQTIDRVLDLSRIESGSLELRPVPLELAPLIERQVRDLSLLAEERGLDLTCQIEVPDAIVPFDAYCLNQALTNLLQNAIKFTERGGVAARLFLDAEGRICLEISDSGIGIDPAFLPRLFEPFSQEESGYSRRFEGSGLGLALTKRYLELNDARLSVRSEKHRGTTFTVHFPAAGELAQGPQDAEQPADRGSIAIGNGRHEDGVVIVVDDDADTQRYMRSLLRDHYRVIVAASGEELRRRLESLDMEVAAVLMDFSLKGGEDGLQLTRFLRSRDDFKSVPIIATTAHAFHDDRIRASSAGCDAFLAKPFDRDHLLETLKNATVAAAASIRIHQRGFS
jgi:PAS domain S-box-containing protein